jgi:hypothetical protein
MNVQGDTDFSLAWFCFPTDDYPYFDIWGSSGSVNLTLPRNGKNLVILNM